MAKLKSFKRINYNPSCFEKFMVLDRVPLISDSGEAGGDLGYGIKYSVIDGVIRFSGTPNYDL